MVGTSHQQCSTYATPGTPKSVHQKKLKLGGAPLHTSEVLLHSLLLLLVLRVHVLCVGAFDEDPRFQGGLLVLVGPLARLPAAPVDHSAGLVHHADQEGLVARVDGSHRDVSHRTELATVVQMFIFQPEEVPHEAPAPRRKTKERHSFNLRYCALEHRVARYPKKA